jgi:hypothetical protein
MSAVTDTAPLGAWRRIIANVTAGGDVTCRFVNELGESGETSWTAPDPEGYVGIRVYDTRATFLSWAVYQ